MSSFGSAQRLLATRPNHQLDPRALPLPRAAVTKNKRRIEEIKEEIDGRRQRKGSSEQQAVKNKLAELRGQFQTLVVRGTRI